MNPSNPYAPPPLPEGARTTTGVANPEFGIGAILGEAWTLSSGCKGVFLLVYFVIFFTTWLLQILLGSLFGVAHAPGSSMLAGLAAQLLLAAAIYPFLAGVMKLALLRADGQAVRAADAYAHGASIKELALLGVLLTLATGIGFSLLLLPGIYLSVALVFALPLVIDRRLGALEALMSSRRAIHPRWFRCAGLLLALGVILVLAAVTVIGLIWAMPVTAIAVALAYRRFFPAPVTASAVIVDGT